MYSTTFAHYYDQLMGDYSSITSTTKQLVKEYLPKKSSILELGCGTGNMLSALSSRYTLSGLDNASGMLEIAKGKVHSATYYKDDMATFRLRQKFDGIICIFDTINHLPTFTQWQKLFSHVSLHLKPKGIFIFDMNTQRRLDRLSQVDPYVGKLDSNTLTRVKILKKGLNQYDITFHLYEDITSKKVKYTEEIVVESAHPAEKVKSALQKHFHIEKMKDPIRNRITTNTGRIFFVCKKK